MNGLWYRDEWSCSFSRNAFDQSILARSTRSFCQPAAQEGKPLTLAGCWAHLRRGFFEALEQSPRQAGWTLRQIGHLYSIERKLRDQRAGTQSRQAYRASQSQMVYAVHLILQLGYFKAKRQFFVYAREAVREDLEHILRRHFRRRRLGDIKGLSKPTRLEQQQVILKLFGYQLCDTAAKSELEQKAKRVAMLSTQPIFNLREVLQYLTNQRISASSPLDTPIYRIWSVGQFPASVVELLLNPLLGFYFPLFSMVFPWGISISVVTCGK